MTTHIIIKQSKRLRKGYAWAYTFVKIGGKTFKLEYECGNNYLHRKALVLLDNGSWAYTANSLEAGHQCSQAGRLYYGSEPEEHEKANSEFVASMIEHLELLFS